MSPVAELKNGTDEYVELVPEDVAVVILRLDVIDAEIMKGAIAERFFPQLRIQQLLAETTALHSYFASRYLKWKAIKDNREVEAYMGIKERTISTGAKFVSAPAERAAANEVRAVNYLVAIYEGNLRRCEQYVNTTKKLLETMTQEKHNS